MSQSSKPHSGENEGAEKTREAFGFETLILKQNAVDGPEIVTYDNQESVKHSILSPGVQDKHENTETGRPGVADVPDGPSLRDIGDPRRQAIVQKDAAGAADKRPDGAPALRPGGEECGDVTVLEILKHGRVELDKRESTPVGLFSSCGRCFVEGC